MYELFEHTADLGLRVTAADQETLFAEAACGLFSMIVEDLDQVRPELSVPVRIDGEDRAYLFFDWLSELLLLFETRRLLLAEFDVDLVAGGLRAEARGEAYDPARHRLVHEIKAITYHGLRVEHTEEGWQAEVIVDV